MKLYSLNFEFQLNTFNEDTGEPLQFTCESVHTMYMFSSRVSSWALSCALPALLSFAVQ